MEPCEGVFEGVDLVGGPYISTYTAVFVTLESLDLLQRPDDVRDCFVLQVPAIDLFIPWPSGMTAPEAVAAWKGKADAQQVA